MNIWHTWICPPPPLEDSATVQDVLLNKAEIDYIN